MRSIRSVSVGTSRFRYSRTVSSPCTRKAVSTRSPPLSRGLKGITVPVSPLIQCDQAPWKRSAPSRNPTTRFHRSIASARVIKPRSTPTTMAISPKPLPPLVTNRPLVLRSRAMPLLGSAKSQKYLKVCSCTRVSSSSSDTSGKSDSAAGPVKKSRVRAVNSRLASSPSTCASASSYTVKSRRGSAGIN